jgi:methionyl-tRNA formyltransferase
MRMVFCGSGEVAVAALEAVRAAGHDVASVVTQPPHKAGRRGRLTPTPVDERAAELDLPVMRCPNINLPEFESAIRELSPRLFVVVDFGQKIGRPVRDIAPLGAVNMHASLLPELRGAAPVNWAVIRGLTRTGVTTFALVDQMDAGPIYLAEPLDIGPEETAEELRGRLAGLGSEVLLRTIAGLEAGGLQSRPQDPAKATAAPKLAKADGRIEFAQSASDLANRIRGVWPWPGAHAEFVRAGRPSVRVVLAKARAMADEPAAAGIGGATGVGGAPAAAHAPAAPGEVTADLHVQAGRGRLEILELQVAGGRLMGWRDFINGYRVAAGDRFATPEAS